MLSKAVDKIQKARKTLRYGTGKYPDDDEIARLTGLSLAKIASADKCLRVVGSLDDRIGDFSSPKFLVRLLFCVSDKTFVHFVAPRNLMPDT